MQSTAVKSYALDLDWSAQTMLPIELEGAELQLEARAYQGSDPRNQAFVLINRTDQASSGKETGKESGGQLPLVRVHSGCITGDIFHSLKCDCYPQLQASLKKIVNAPLGILIYLPYHEGRGIGLVAKIRAYALQEQGYDTVDANVAVGAPIEAREYDLAAHILFDLGYPEIKLLSNNPAKSDALRAEGIKVAETVPVITKPNVHNVRYLETKRARMSHRLPSQVSALAPAVAQPAE